MITQKENRKQLIDFLIYRWQSTTNSAALEKVYIALCGYAQSNNLPMPLMPLCVISQPCRQIEIIKQYIIKILPEVHFIDYDFEAQAPLDPNDFVEIYIADHEMCITKIGEVMKKMQIK